MPCLIYLSSRGFYLRGADKTRHCRNDAIYSDHHTPPPPPPFPTAPYTISSRRYFAGDILHDLRPGSSSNMTQFDDLKKQNAAAGGLPFPPAHCQIQERASGVGQAGISGLSCRGSIDHTRNCWRRGGVSSCPTQFHLLCPVFA